MILDLIFLLPFLDWSLWPGLPINYYDAWSIMFTTQGPTHKKDHDSCLRRTMLFFLFMPTWVITFFWLGSQNDFWYWIAPLGLAYWPYRSRLFFYSDHIYTPKVQTVSGKTQLIGMQGVRRAHQDAPQTFRKEDGMFLEWFISAI